jgi:hypothetical protein
MPEEMRLRQAEGEGMLGLAAWRRVQTCEAEEGRGHGIAMLVFAVCANGLGGVGGVYA